MKSWSYDECGRSTHDETGSLILVQILRHPRLSEAQALLFRETVTGIAVGTLTTA